MAADKLKPRFGKTRDQGPVESLVLIPHKFMNPFTQGIELHLWSHPRDVNALVADVHLVFQRSDAHHEELIQVGRGNGQEFQPFKQGHDLCVPRFAEAAHVKLQPGELAVIEIVIIRQG